MCSHSYYFQFIVLLLFDWNGHFFFQLLEYEDLLLRLTVIAFLSPMNIGGRLGHPSVRRTGFNFQVQGSALEQDTNHFCFCSHFRQNGCVVTRGAFLDVLVCLCGPKISLLDGEFLLGHLVWLMFYWVIVKLRRAAHKCKLLFHFLKYQGEFLHPLGDVYFCHMVQLTILYTGQTDGLRSFFYHIRWYQMDRYQPLIYTWLFLIKIYALFPEKLTKMAKKQSSIQVSGQSIAVFV